MGHTVQRTSCRYYADLLSFQQSRLPTTVHVRCPVSPDVQRPEISEITVK